MKRILITGANRGIGLEFTRHYLIRGQRVYATYRHFSDELDQLQKQYGDQLTLFEVELTGDLQPFYEKLRQHTDALDILINNAGILRTSQNLSEIQADALLDSFAVNTVAPIRIIQRLTEMLERGENPKIVNITMPTRPIEQLSTTSNHSYFASRYALNALTKMIAVELASKGMITVALYPGYIKTDMNQMAEEASPASEMIPKNIEVIENLTMQQNGCCLLPDGRSFAW